MKFYKFILLLGFLITISQAKAQYGEFSGLGHAYLTIGYNGAFTNLSGVNSVVDNFNETRPWLDEKMGHFSYLDGLNVDLGFSLFVWWIEFGYDFRSQERSASGTDEYGDFNTRELKINNATTHFTLGLFIPKNEKALGIGCRIDFGNIKAETRVFGDSYAKEDFKDIGDRYSALRIGPSIKFLTFTGISGLMISGSLYYMWHISSFTENVEKLDENLNNTNYFGDYPSKFNLDANSFGFSLAIGFGVGAN